MRINRWCCQSWFHGSIHGTPRPVSREEHYRADTHSRAWYLVSLSWLLPVAQAGEIHTAARQGDVKHNQQKSKGCMMGRDDTNRALVWGLLATLLLSATGFQTQADWPQWGGPNRNFTVQTTGLAESWSEEGPPRMWQRMLGAGYSAIVYDDGLLFTMYRPVVTAAEEFTVALDAKTGEEVWSHRNPAPLVEPPDQRWGGQGPNSTPLIVGDRLITIGSRAVIHCLDKRTGKVLWRHDMVGDDGATLSKHVGYCCSPVAYGNTLITADYPRLERNEEDELARRRRMIELESRKRVDGQALMAFDLDTGKQVWKNLDFEIGFSSPILINFAGQDQLVMSTHDGLVGLDPVNGDLLWHHPVMCSEVTPVWDGQDIIFFTAGGQRMAGQALRLTKEGDRTIPREHWICRKMRIMIPSAVYVDGHLYGATERVLLGVDTQTGKRTWARRGFPNATCLYADSKLILLDENGHLGLAQASPEKITILAECQVMDRYALTVPTLVGTTLYVRDRQRIMALDLGK
ncbi:MAG: PQQ-binding-like beta-propeller repeat protein [Planctomycetota bacterium]